MDFIRKSQFIIHGMRNFTKRSHPFPALEERLNGVVALVTGASAGLGLGIATNLACRGATVHLICRNKERGEAILKKIV
jgi:dehydrogenase/reductase SDR family protein 12